MQRVAPEQTLIAVGTTLASALCAWDLSDGW